MRFTDIVNEHYNELNSSELLMCNYIIENTAAIPKMGVVEFAKRSLSSKSSVIRFSQKLGFTGFTELKNFIKWQDQEEVLVEQLTFKEQVTKDIHSLLEIIGKSDWS
ncbi:MurR/RpiR family transcriptional regulator, partial [Streptococcus merionis]